MFPALNMAEFVKKKDTVCVIALYMGHGGESSRSTFKRIPLRFALLPMELFEPLPCSPQACVRTLWNVLVSGSCSAPKRATWMHARTHITHFPLSPSEFSSLELGVTDWKREGEPIHDESGLEMGERNTAFWRSGKGTGGNTCNDALVNNTPGLKRYTNVQTNLYLTLISEVL